MNTKLNPIEIRILGCLIEKEYTTPEYYPLSLNALTNACNQKSSRNPIMNLEEQIILQNISNMRFKKLMWELTVMGSRVPRYKHNICLFHEFTKNEISVICSFFLYGPQTLGETRIHASRFNEIKTIDEAKEIIDKLSNIEGGPYITLLPHEPGQREQRYMHLFGGEELINQYITLSAQKEPQTIEFNIEDKRITQMENEIALLRKEIEDIKNQFINFRKQFE